MLNTGITIRKASFLGGFFVCLVLTALAGCEPQKEADKMVFRYNEPAGIPTLDPAFAKDKSTIWAVQQLFESLVALDAENEIVPALAAFWSVSENGRVYEFSLREAYFHDGRKLSPADVVYSLKRLQNPAIASPGSWVLDDVLGIYESVWGTVIVELHAPNASFLSLLAMPYCGVMPAGAVEAATSPVGTGPFKIHRWYYGEKLVLHKHEQYWKQDAEGQPLPYLDGISVSFLPDQQSAFLEYLSGNFDFLPNLDPSFKDDLLTKSGELQSRYQESHRLERTPFLNTEYLIFNAEKGLSKELRWALNAGINREEMIQSLRNGVGIPARGGIVPFGLPEYQDSIGAAYAPDSVAALLASMELPELTLVTVANYRDLCEYVQGEMAGLGWSIAVNVVPSATLRSEKSAGTLDFFRASWIADYPDAENYLMLFYSGYKAPNGPNYSLYENARYDAMYEQIRALPPGEERSALMRKADQYLMQEQALVPLFYDEVLRVYPEYVRGVESNALNALNLLEARFER